MRISKVLETSDGSVTFSGELGPPEVEFLLEFALNSMYERGALPFLTKEQDVEPVDVHRPAKLEQ